MSVRMTSTCMFSRNARNSAAVSAARGVTRRSTEGSSARLRKQHDFFEHARFLEVAHEIARDVVLDPHRGEDDGELNVLPR